MPFAMGSNEDLATVIDTVNYLTANLGQANVLTVNQQNGQISSPLSSTVVAYLYQWIEVRYGDSSTGANISKSPTNKKYYGLRNSATPIIFDENPADYVWYQVAGNGFGTTKSLYYQTIGGRAITWFVGTVPPNNTYVQVQDGVPINLDTITSVNTTAIVTLNIYQRSATQPATPTGGLYDFTSLVLSPPAGWSASVPPGTDSVWSSSNTFTNPSEGTIAGPALPWSTPSIAAQAGSSNLNLVAYARNQNTPTTPTGGSWNFTTNSGTPPTGGDGTVWTLNAVPPGTDQLWATSSVATIIGSQGTATNLTWSTPGELSTPGTDGTSTIIGYARVSGNPTPNTGSILTTGPTYPTSAESSATWGFAANWVSSDPDPSSANSLYQTVGTYNPTTNVTTWVTPYVASLKVPFLSQISPNLGTVTNGNLTANTVTVSTGFLTVSIFTAAQVANITGQLGQLCVISNSAQGSNPNGMLAFWDTTHNRWSYVHDNSAV